MKHTIRILIGIGLAMTTTSCVVPYESATVTTYRPGYITHSLPHGYRTEVIAGTRYYHHNGVYYRSHSRPGQYVVVASPHGGSYHREERVIRELPRGYRTIRRNGTVYYQYGNSYYQRRNHGYVIVELR